MVTSLNNLLARRAFFEYSREDRFEHGSRKLLPELDQLGYAC
jgi:hypothetical protein